MFSSGQFSRPHFIRPTTFCLYLRRRLFGDCGLVYINGVIMFIDSKWTDFQVGIKLLFLKRNMFPAQYPRPCSSRLYKKRSNWWFGVYSPHKDTKGQNIFCKSRVGLKRRRAVRWLGQFPLKPPPPLTPPPLNYIFSSKSTPPVPLCPYIPYAFSRVV